MFLHMGPQGDRIVGAIELGNSRQRIAYDAVVALREARALDREFFQRLREKRPHRGDEIAALEARWPGDAVAGVRATHVITLVAEVAGQAAAIDDEQIRDALGACEERSRLQLDLHDFGGAAPAWSAGQDKIRTAVQRYLREVVLPSGVRHVSLFGLAPIPWLMTLGHAISETVEARVFQRLRTPSTWTWQTEDAKEGGWLTRQVSAAPDARAVAVLISASARVQLPRVDAALLPSSRAVYEISLARPRIDAGPQRGAVRRVRSLLPRVARPDRRTAPHDRTCPCLRRRASRDGDRLRPAHPAQRRSGGDRVLAGRTPIRAGARAAGVRLHGVPQTGQRSATRSVQRRSRSSTARS
jgi:hypothetical protein